MGGLSKEGVRGSGAGGGEPAATLREKGTPAAELGLLDPAVSDEVMLDAMVAHPILVNRPIVVTPKGTRLCRPSEQVLALLPPHRAPKIAPANE